MKNVIDSLIFLTIVFCFLQGFMTEASVIQKQHPCSDINSQSKNQTNDRPNCIFTNNDHHVRCYGDDYGSFYSREEKTWSTNGSNVMTLIICNSTNVNLNPQDIIKVFPDLKKLLIINGNLSRFITAFPEEAVNLEKIHIIGTKLQYFPSDVFAYLPSLDVADLRNNELKSISPRAFNVTTIKRVYLAGNLWKCDENMFWILDSSVNNSLANKIMDRKKMMCSSPYPARPLVPIIDIIMSLTMDCNRTAVCDCKLVYVVARRNHRHMQPQSLMAFISVNCSYRGLKEMPQFIPANTTTLHLVGNNISDLSPLVTNPVYRHVLDVYLDNNTIESITNLEGSYWLDNFRVLSLRGNKLVDLPTYALENVLLQSGSAVIYLGNNPWTCDCQFTPGFQELLVRYMKLVKDVNDVRCAPSAEHPKIDRKLIRDLTRREICIASNSKDFPIYPLDILNIFLASAIIFIVGKLLYDYWVYKKTGKLPWIVTKIP